MVHQKAFIVTGGKEANILLGSEYGKSWKKYKTPIIQGEKMTGIFSMDNLSMDTAIIAEVIGLQKRIKIKQWPLQRIKELLGN